MNGSRNRVRRDEAARWFAARRRGVMALDEREAYAVWLRDAANAAAMAEFERLWKLVSIAEPYLSATPGGHRAVRGNSAVRSALVAAMCAVSIGIAALSYSGSPAFWTTLDWTDR